MPLALTAKPVRDHDSALAIDLCGIVPDRVSTVARDAVARLAIEADGRAATLGDLFDLAGDGSDGVIECRGDFSRVHFLGAGMAWGTLRVFGHAGRHAGERMTGGRIEIEGDAGDWLACDMAGGEVEVRGSAGDNAAAALPGSPCGMQGGLVTIAGDAGHLAGSRMRRGMLAIGGDCGDAAGFELRAGTVVVAGRVGGHPGLGMRRGSILLLGSTPPSLGHGFHRGATWRPPVLAMLLRRLARSGFSPEAATRAAAGGWHHWHGDRLAGGRGEIFLPAG